MEIFKLFTIVLLRQREGIRDKGILDQTNHEVIPTNWNDHP